MSAAMSPANLLSRQQLLTEAYRAFNARDIDAVLALMGPEVDWPNGMDHTRALGHAAVRDYWTRQWAVINPRVDPLRFTEDPDGRVTIDVRQVVHDLTGNLLDDRTIQHTYTFRDGLIARMDISEATPATSE